MNNSPLDITTCSLPFGHCSADGHPLFTVQAGIPLLEALESASVALRGACCLSESVACDDNPQQQALQWASLQLTEMAKALIDASTLGLLKQA